MTASTDEKKIWVALVDVKSYELEDELNKLAEDGYQVHSIHQQVEERALYCKFVVVAFDGARIMKRQGENMVAQVNALMAGVRAPGTP